MPELSADIAFAEDTARILKVLGHPARLQIVSVLSHVREAHVTGLIGCLDLPQAIVSQQLALLHTHGLVTVERKDGYSWYSLAEPRVARLVRCMEAPATEPCPAPES